MTRDLRATPLRVVNLGLDLFAEELERQDVPVTRVRWRPPAGGKARLLGLLEKLKELDG